MAVKRYNGTSWDTVAGLGAQGAAATSSSITTWVKTASGGETSLTGSSDSSTTLAYTPGQEQVFINGVLQVRGSDYTATNGTSITGLTALVAGDIATVTTVNAFSVTGAVPLSTVTANGDLIVGTSAGAVGRLAIGTTGQVLTVASGVPTWATPAGGGGKVLQVVNATVAAARSTTSGSFVDITDATASITPSASTSKILVMANLPGAYVSVSGGTTAYGIIQTLRTSTAIGAAYTGKYVSGGTGGTLIGDVYAGVTMVIYDSPATTSSTTYKLQFRMSAGTTFYASDGAAYPISLTLMEIGA